MYVCACVCVCAKLNSCAVDCLIICTGYNFFFLSTSISFLSMTKEIDDTIYIIKMYS